MDEAARRRLVDALTITAAAPTDPDALEAGAREMGHDLVRLDSARALTEAHALYRRCGYAEIPRYNDNPYAHFWFEKRLA